MIILISPVTFSRHSEIKSVIGFSKTKKNLSCEMPSINHLTLCFSRHSFFRWVIKAVGWF